MSTRLACYVLAIQVVACSVAPELKFSSDEESANGDAAPDSTPPVGGDDAGASPHDGAPSDAGQMSDAFELDSAGPPTDAPPDASASPSDAALSCTPNPQFGIGCCASGDQCVGVACQNCQDCTACNLPNFFCAVVNGGGKYKSMKCGASPIGCP